MKATAVELRERTLTIRQEIQSLLSEGAYTTREIARTVGLREKDVTFHLEHLRRSLRRSRKNLRIEPAQCLPCGFVFRNRQRLSRPGSCPRCRSRHVEAPLLRIVEP